MSRQYIVGQLLASETRDGWTLITPLDPDHMVHAQTCDDATRCAILGVTHMGWEQGVIMEQIDGGSWHLHALVGVVPEGLLLDAPEVTLLRDHVTRDAEYLREHHMILDVVDPED